MPLFANCCRATCKPPRPHRRWYSGFDGRRSVVDIVSQGSGKPTPSKYDTEAPVTTLGTAKTTQTEVFGNIDLMFRAFSDRTRLRILRVLQGGELCVGDIVAILQAPQPRVSRHLAYLRKANLVLVRKSGLWSHYSLAKARTPFHR